MSGSASDFPDPLEELLREANRLTDKDLERYISERGAGRSGASPVSLEPGSCVEGTVIELRGEEVLVELDDKTYGVVELAEFEDERPFPGQRLRATFDRYDPSRDLALLSVRGVRREVAWESLRPGAIIEGLVSGYNKGGLTLQVKGVAAFMPISQVELGGVEDLSAYVGRKLKCQVVSLDHVRKTAIVSRKAIQESEAALARERAFQSLSEGQVLRGTVVQVGDRGTLVDLGGVVGFLPKTATGRGTGAQPVLDKGQEIEVQIVRLDRERKRASLQLRCATGDSWRRAAQHYSPGDRVTGWVSNLTEEGVILSIEEGVTGLIPRSSLGELEELPRPGNLLRATVVSIETERQRLILAPAPRGGIQDGR